MTWGDILQVLFKSSDVITVPGTTVVFPTPGLTDFYR